MEGLRAKTYMRAPRKAFDPLALLVSVLGFAMVLVAVSNVGAADELFDMRSLLIVVLGTVVTTLFQYDFRTFATNLRILGQSFLALPDKPMCRTLEQLDQAIVDNAQLASLREGKEIDGELLNDIVYMYNRGLLFEEIDSFVTGRISDEFLARKTAASMLRRAAIIAPALGLFGTVIGLIGVLKSMNDPGSIGPSMSLALMTTAYGAGFGTLLLNPLSGRLEHNNAVYLEVHKQLLAKVAVLLTREERRMDSVHVPTTSEQA